MGSITIHFSEGAVVMKDWDQKSVFNTWTEAQKQLWESLSKTLPAFPSVAGSEMWQQGYMKNLDTWEAAVKQILELQAKWLDQWATVEKGKAENEMSEAANKWTCHVNDAMQGWMQAQNQLWEDWFEALRAAGEKASEALPAERMEPVVPEKPTADVVVARSTAKPLAKPVEEPAEAAMESEEIPVVAGTVPAGAAQISPKDDLTALTGLGPVMEKKLNAHGIFSYRQIAELGDENIKNIEENVLKAGNRFDRYNWISQAREQHFNKYGVRI